MTKWFRNNTDEEITNKREIQGTIDESITSSILEFGRQGACLGAVMQMKLLIDGLTATMWSVVALSMKAGKGDDKARSMIDSMDSQINHQLNLIHQIVMGFAEGKGQPEGETIQ